MTARIKAKIKQDDKLEKQFALAEESALICFFGTLKDQDIFLLKLIANEIKYK